MGREQVNAEELAGLVRRARQGDQTAVSDLYEKTYSSVFYTVKAMIRDEDAVFDILQDSYLKAFSHLDSLTDDRFLSWMKTIAANTARDWLKKQRPLLFSELNTNEEIDAPAEEQFVDERFDHMPEAVIEQEETGRLLREILEGLPEDQRAAIGMFYYEELSVKDIAAAMGCTESAVKSRLMYGRRKVEKEVRALEKKGTKLYGLAPVPFLLWLLRTQEAYGAGRPDGRILDQVLRLTAKGSFSGGAKAAAAGKAAAGAAGTGTAAAGTGAAAGAAAGTAAGLGGLKLGLLIAAAVAVVGGSTFGIVKLVSRTDPVPAQEVSYSGSGELLTRKGDPKNGGETEPGQPATKPQNTSSAETKAPETAGTAAEETAEPETSAPEQTADPEEEAILTALEYYRAILAQADSIEFAEMRELTPTGFKYALVQMEKGDAVPTLLLAKEWDQMYCRTRVFQYDPEHDVMHQPEDQLEWGMSQFGYRGGLNLEADGGGLANSEFSSGSGQGTYVRVRMENGALKTETQWSGRLDQTDQPEVTLIQWLDLSDNSDFERWSRRETRPEGREPETVPQSREGGADVTTGEQGAANGPQAATLPEDGGRIVFTGTIKRCSYEETIELQGYPDPNAQWTDHSRTFLLLILDEPQDMDLHAGDENKLHSGVVDLILVTDEYARYIGEHHIFSIDPWTTYRPTDTSMPLGRPRTGDLKILD